MLDIIKKYNKYAIISYKLKLCVEKCNIRDKWQFINIWNKCIENIEALINEVSDRPEVISEKVKNIGRKIQTNINDYMQCANIIEEELLPLIGDEIKKIEIEFPIDDEFELVKSKSGLLTLRNRISNKWMHSINNPMSEAYSHANYLYRAEADNILICGAGLGYLAYQLWEKSYKSAHVYIFEKSKKAIELAKNYGVLDWIDNDKLTVISSSDDGKIFDELFALPIDFDNAICWVSEWFIDSVEDVNILRSIENFSENIITRECFRNMDRVNIKKNIQNTIGDISTLKEERIGCGQEYIVVAAGPSLDYSLDYIKECIGTKKIVAVESVLKKLLINGIKPDYVAVLDPTELIMKYITGIEDMTSELVLVASEKSYWGYVEKFAGRKYIISARLDEDDSDIHNAISSCTTVSSFAVEIAIYLGAESIELVGLDLSFPNNKAYANQISDVDKVSVEQYVRSVEGKIVGSSKAFVQFKCEIEEIIRKNKNIKFYNLSKNGAFIRGTLMGKWWEEKPTNYNRYLKMLAEDTILECSEKYYILWQTICNHLKNVNDNSAREISDSDFWNEVTKVYTLVSDEFLGQLGDIKRADNYNEKYVILLTSLYSAEADEISEKIRQDAYTLKKQHGFDVMIVNTREYLGGNRVALMDSNELVSDEVMLNSETVFYMGERIPYFAFEEGMPDVQQIKSFITAISQRAPISFIAYDSLSLVASACKMIGTVEYR